MSGQESERDETTHDSHAVNRYVCRGETNLCQRGAQIRRPLFFFSLHLARRLETSIRASDFLTRRTCRPFRTAAVATAERTSGRSCFSFPSYHAVTAESITSKKVSNSIEYKPPLNGLLGPGSKKPLASSALRKNVHNAPDHEGREQHGY